MTDLWSPITLGGNAPPPSSRHGAHPARRAAEARAMENRARFAIELTRAVSTRARFHSQWAQ